MFVIISSVVKKTGGRHGKGQQEMVKVNRKWIPNNRPFSACVQALTVYYV